MNSPSTLTVDVPPSVTTPQPAAPQEPDVRFRSSRRTASLTGFRIAGIGFLRSLSNCHQRGTRTALTDSKKAGCSDAPESPNAASLLRISPPVISPWTPQNWRLSNANIPASDVDLLVVGTFTPDYMCPSTACLVQNKLQLDAPAMDLQAACSGFMYSLATAAQFIASGNARCALVIGADVNSRIVRPDDQRTAPLFGDGAGAVILQPGDRDQGLVCYQLGADGSGGSLLDRPAGGSTLPLTPELVQEGRHYLQMDGRNVFKWAIHAVTESITTVLEKAGVTTDDVSLFVLHQANIRIIDHAMKELGIHTSRVFNNLSTVGNTSAASIPLALDGALQKGLIRRGDLIVMCGFGAWLTWGTGLFRW
ncbi:MAG UNVERIFIED_CONTAM: ketoacyl-ACP synthase III [Planctomycetaceae bacterium]|jgi:3-oxoacyl-[acyl-carrier-protein] synthase-3